MLSPMLETILRRTAEDFPAQTALLAVDLSSGEPFAAIRPEERVLSASTIKVPILCCALQEVQAGTLRLDQTVPVLPEDFCDDTEVFEPFYRGREFTLRELLYWMIVSSDNTASNAVISLLGFSRINDFCTRQGLTHTVLQRKMLDWQAAERGLNNYTSPMDQYRLYSALYRGELLDQDLRETAFDLLSRCRSFDALQRYIPDPVPVLHKPGQLDHLTHDAGIFLLGDRPYFLGVFTWDGPALDGQPQQKRLIGQLSRMVYDFVKRGGTQ